MTSRFVELRLLSPVAVSADSATVGGHRSLTRIPGAQLLGAVASALRLDPNAALPPDAYRILCSGAVRFGDAWPATPVAGVPAFPAPLALHHEKGLKPEDGVELYNLARGGRPAGVQLVQVRDRLVTHDRIVVTPRLTHTLRTAIAEGGRSREGLLFGIEALDAGQSFLARIDGDDDELLESVLGLLRKRPIRVGRSRRAEFGQVEVAPADPWDVATTAGDAGEITLWLVSDMALRDHATGSPRLQPGAEDFGLPDGWRLVPERTFVRVRRYSPFNGARRRPDLERQVLQAGSVLVFRGDEPLDRASVRGRLRRGVGMYRNDGLGRVVMDPSLLAEERLRMTVPGQVSVAEVDAPTDELGVWLRNQRDEQERASARGRRARQLVGRLRHPRIKNAQWGEIRRLARQARFGPGRSWLATEVERFLEQGARIHTWPRPIRELLIRELKLEAEAALDPATVELAATLLVRPAVEES